jgi:hypothetical protein
MKLPWDYQLSPTFTPEVLPLSAVVNWASVFWCFLYSFAMYCRREYLGTSEVFSNYDH